jgi:hypothetical protein
MNYYERADGGGYNKPSRNKQGRPASILYEKRGNARAYKTCRRPYAIQRWPVVAVLTALLLGSAGWAQPGEDNQLNGHGDNKALQHRPEFGRRQDWGSVETKSSKGEAASPKAESVRKAHKGSHPVDQPTEWRPTTLDLESSPELTVRNIAGDANGLEISLAATFTCSDISTDEALILASELNTVLESVGDESCSAALAGALAYDAEARAACSLLLYVCALNGMLLAAHEECDSSERRLARQPSRVLWNLNRGPVVATEVTTPTGVSGTPYVADVPSRAELLEIARRINLVERTGFCRAPFKYCFGNSLIPDCTPACVAFVEARETRTRFFQGVTIFGVLGIAPPTAALGTVATLISAAGTLIDAIGGGLCERCATASTLNELCALWDEDTRRIVPFTPPWLSEDSSGLGFCAPIDLVTPFRTTERTCIAADRLPSLAPTSDMSAGQPGDGSCNRASEVEGECFGDVVTCDSFVSVAYPWFTSYVAGYTELPFSQCVEDACADCSSEKLRGSGFADTCIVAAFNTCGRCCFP